jgi:hypothetical protein
MYWNVRDVFEWDQIVSHLFYICAFRDILLKAICKRLLGWYFKVLNTPWLRQSSVILQLIACFCSLLGSTKLLVIFLPGRTVDSIYLCLLKRFEISLKLCNSVSDYETRPKSNEFIDVGVVELIFSDSQRVEHLGASMTIAEISDFIDTC